MKGSRSGELANRQLGQCAEGGLFVRSEQRIVPAPRSVITADDFFAAI